MRKLGTRLTFGMAAAAIGLTGLSGCGSLDGTEIVATIDGEEVTLGLASYLARVGQAQTQSYYDMMAQSYGVDMGSGGFWDEEGESGKTYGESTKDSVMDTIREMYVLRAHAEEYGVTISDEEQAQIEEAAAQFMEDNSAETLEALAVSEEDIITYLQLSTYRERMYDPMVADVDTEVSDEEAAQTRITFVEVSTVGTETDEDGNTIELTDEEKAEKKDIAQQVWDKVNASEDVANADMDALAKEVDEDLADNDRIFTSSGEGDEVTDQAIKDAVADLEDGQLVPEVVEGEDAYYVVRLDKKYDEEATESKKRVIISDREEELYNDLLTEWTDAADMEIDNSVWRKVKLTDSQPYTLKTQDTTTTDEAADSAETDEAAASEDSAETDETAAGEDTQGTDQADSSGDSSGAADEDSAAADETAEGDGADEAADAAEDSAE